MIKNSIQIGKNIPNTFDKQYIFDLNLIFNDGTQQKINKINNIKSIEMITTDMNINYNTIKKFSIKVSVIDLGINSYSLNNNLDLLKDSNTFQNSNLFIEFTNINNILLCTCYVIESNHFMFLTPPNY